MGKRWVSFVVALLVCFMSVVVPVRAEGEKYTFTGDDVNVIPDKYNTGLTDSSVLTVITGEGTYNGVQYSTYNEEGRLKVIVSSLMKDRDSIVIENIDVSGYQLNFVQETVDSSKTITFRNCKFGSFLNGQYESSIQYEFENCEFSRFYGSNAHFNRCKFGGSYSDGLNPFVNVTVENSFFTDMAYMLESGSQHTDGVQTFGKEGVDVHGIFIKNCRFEIPAIPMSGNMAYVNACLFICPEYSNGYDITVTDCILNGGGKMIYASAKSPYTLSDVTFSNLRLGTACRYGTGLDSISSEVAVCEGNESLDSLYIGSVWKDEGNIHVSVTNDTNVERTLRVKSGDVTEEFVIPACPMYDDVVVDTLEYSDYPFDIDIFVESSEDWVVCFDVTGGGSKQIRYAEGIASSGESTISAGDSVSGNMVVLANAPEEWSFIIPDEVVLSEDESKSGQSGKKYYASDFEVLVRGDIAESHCVKLIIDGTVLNGCEVGLSCPKTVWDREDCMANGFGGTSSGYSMSALLVPGEYTGVMNYTIGLYPLVRESGLYDSSGVLVQSWESLKELGVISVEDGSLSASLSSGTITDEAKSILDGVLVIDEEVSSIADYAFHGAEGLIGIEMPNSANEVGAYAFSGCSGLSKVEMGKDVSSLGKYAFEGCSSLTDVELPDDILTLSEGVFSGCSSLYFVRGGLWVTKIEAKAFSGCSSLTGFSSSAGLEYLGRGAFSGCGSLSSIELPSEMSWIDGDVFKDCYSLREIVFPGGLTAIKYNTFSGCTALESITISGDVTSIETGAFRGCTSLGGIELPSGLVVVGARAFNGCTSLTGVDLPASVGSIAEAAFQGCIGLEGLVIPEGITRLNDNLVSGCTSLKAIEIPSTVTEIGSGVFRNCKALKEIVIPSGVASIGSSAFNECETLESIVLPESVSSIGGDIFGGCRGLVRVKLPEGISEIPSGAFYNCSKLSTISIPSSVSSIGSKAFGQCLVLELVVPDTVVEIGENAFVNVKNVQYTGTAEGSPWGASSIN